MKCCRHHHHALYFVATRMPHDFVVGFKNNTFGMFSVSVSHLHTGFKS